VKRRAFLGSILVLGTLKVGRPEALPVRKAVFEEVGNSVFITVSLPSLFRRSDKEALASIDSGFDTTLVFQLRLWEIGTRALVAEESLIVKIRRDPWKRQYTVRTRTPSGWAKREFATRDQALNEATTLVRVRLVAADRLGRGANGPFYFAEVLALRNPLVAEPSSSGGTNDGRAQGRDLEWFGTLVDVLAGEQARAEESVHLRTNAFYLLPR